MSGLKGQLAWQVLRKASSKWEGHVKEQHAVKSPMPWFEGELFWWVRSTAASTGSWQQGRSKVRVETSIGLVGAKQGGIHGLQAGGAGEGSHEPGIDAVHVIRVQTRQVAHGLPQLKVHHADHTPAKEWSDITL